MTPDLLIVTLINFICCIHLNCLVSLLNRMFALMLHLVHHRFFHGKKFLIYDTTFRVKVTSKQTQLSFFLSEKSFYSVSSHNIHPQMSISCRLYVNMSFLSGSLLFVRQSASIFYSLSFQVLWSEIFFPHS